LVFAHRLADAAAEVTLAHFRQAPAVENKAGAGDFDPVTAADRGAEAAMRAMIAEAYPEHGILGEEQGEEPARGAGRWVLDPIDGTRAFVCGVPLWGTLIGFEAAGRARIGIADQPYIGERFAGWPGGAEVTGPRGRVPLRVSDCRALATARLGTTAPDLFAAGAEQAGFDRVRAKVRLIRLGGDCYFYALLAAGHLDIVVEAGLKPFDIVALIPIIEGAGGVVTTWQGAPANSGGPILAAATTELHAEAMAVLGG
jgi:myo-inositol-1(or 4)-monophosphatase